jgi:hypothetical protein
MHSTRAASIAAVVLTAALAASGAPQPPAGPSSPSTPAVPSKIAIGNGTGTVIGTAWRADSTPFPDATIVLRNLQDGRQMAAAVTDARGEFRFASVPRGVYVVELRDKQDQVLSVGEPFAVDDGVAIRTSVRLRARPPWFSGFFRNAAAAAIAAASSVGITAVGSNGLPASPQ